MVFEDYIQKYEQELLHNVVPFWEQHSIDTECGGYFNNLDRDGTVFDHRKDTWMQWRAVYTFATLYGSSYQNPHWLEFAKHGFNFLTRHGKDPNGYYYFALTREGKPLVAPYNIYSEAFATMGSAALYKITREEKYKQEALGAMRHYLARLSHPKMQWEKGLPGQQARLSLGVNMILANLGTIVKDCLGSSEFDAQVARAVDIVVTRFWNNQYKVIFENINSDYTFDLKSADGRHINPGHGLESLWFVLEHVERSGRKDIIAPACQAIKGLLDVGWDKTYGGFFYFMDVLGKPPLELQWDMKLWWVHNEAVLATLFAYRLTKDPHFLEWFKKVDAWAWAHFRDPEYGEWFAYLNRRGEPTHMLKGGRWKCFFHLPRCLLLGIDQMKLIEKTSP